MARVPVDSQPAFNEALAALFARDGRRDDRDVNLLTRPSPVSGRCCRCSAAAGTAPGSAHLYISQHTVRTPIQNTLEKLGTHSKLEAAAFAMRWSFELDPTGTPSGRSLPETATVESRRFPTGEATQGRARGAVRRTRISIRRKRIGDDD